MDEQFAIADVYDNWIEEYMLLKPLPENTNSLSERAQWFALLVFAIIVSANHTVGFLIGEVEHVGQHLVAVSTMAMIELSLVKMSERLMKYISIRYTDAMEVFRIRLLLVGILLVGFVAIGANVLHQMKLSDIQTSEVVVSFVTQIAGITAPIIAIIVGTIFTSMQNDNRFEIVEWERQRNIAWAKFKRKNDVSIKVSKPTDNQTDNRQLSASMSNQTDNRQSGSGFNRASSATDNAVEWLKANPDKIDLPLRELAGLIPNAGKDSIGKARKIIQSEG